MKHKFKHDKGNAGLTIFLSIVVMIFVIGLIVMIFSLMAGELSKATFTSTNGALANETILFSEGGTATSVNNLIGVSLSDVIITNASGGETIHSGNYTIVGGTVTALGSSDYNGTNVNISTTFYYSAPNTATNAINDTGSAIASVVDWFDIFIVIGAMLVLILLTVIIIVSIKGSGMIDATA